jgi:methyl-accepting chemotaxis protein
MAEPNVLQPLGLRTRLPIGIQLVAGIGGLLALVALSILIAVLLVVRLGDDNASLNDHSVPYAKAVAAAALDAKGIANDERGYLMTGDSQFLVQLENRLANARAAFAEAASVTENGVERSAVVEASAGFERWITALETQIVMFESGSRMRAAEAALGPSRDLRKRYERSLARAQVLGDDAIRSNLDAVASASSRSVTILLACLLVALLVGTGVALWLMRTILRPIYTLLALFGEAPRTSRP